MFKRASLSGSADFFQDTASAPELLAETEPETLPAAIHHLPVRPEIQRVIREAIQREPVSYFEYQLTEPQVRALIDAVQKLKYPHSVKAGAKLSMEEFETLEALRQLLLEGLR
ncbi:MAG: hypothetical protein E6I56_03670 [Chloroflexi bacterium]|nr:MAG: hypothetical protein E6I56_03670 [Chloroflexota bacterium]